MMNEERIQHLLDVNVNEGILMNDAYLMIDSTVKIEDTLFLKEENQISEEVIGIEINDRLDSYDSSRYYDSRESIADRKRQ